MSHLVDNSTQNHYKNDWNSVKFAQSKSAGKSKPLSIYFFEVTAGTEHWMVLFSSKLKPFNLNLLPCNASQGLTNTTPFPAVIKYMTTTQTQSFSVRQDSISMPVSQPTLSEAKHTSADGLLKPVNEHWASELRTLPLQVYPNV